jgi:hypothetical protein
LVDGERKPAPRPGRRTGATQEGLNAGRELVEDEETPQTLVIVKFGALEACGDPMYFGVDS